MCCARCRRPRQLLPHTRVPVWCCFRVLAPCGSSPHPPGRLLQAPAAPQADWAVVQPLLTRLLTVDLPGLMVLPKRLEINIPPAVTSVAEAAVGHDIIMRAVASAVLQARRMCAPAAPTCAQAGLLLDVPCHDSCSRALCAAQGAHQHCCRAADTRG